MEQQSSKGDPFEEFDPRVREDVEGLVWLGHIADEFTFAGHTFGLRTLKGSEDLYAGIAAKKFVDSFGQAKAFAWAKVGVALTSVDGQEDFCPPIGPDQESYAIARFNYVTANWYWPLGHWLYTQLLTLEERQLRALQALQSLSAGSPLNFTPYVDSSTEPGTYEDPTSESLSTDSPPSS